MKRLKAISAAAGLAYPIRPEMIVTGLAGKRKADGTCLVLYRNISLKSTAGISAPKVKITQSKDVAEFIGKVISTRIGVQEAFGSLLLNQANDIIGYSINSIGGIAAAPVDVRIIFATAIKALASSIIIFHNHPSNTNKPSDADIQITSKVVASGKALDVTVLDHVIVMPDGNFYSFADNGIMPR